MGHVVELQTPSPLHQAWTEVEVLAARVLRTWRFAVALTLVGAAMAAAILTVALTGHGPRVLALVGVMVLVAALYVGGRLLPRTPVPADRGAELTAEDGDLVKAWIADQCDGWRPEVRLVPHPVALVDRGTLVLGMPLVTCLHDSELAELVRDCAQTAASDDRPAVRRALVVASGWLGGRPGPATETPPSHWYHRRAAARIAELGWARARLSEQVRLQHDDRWQHAVTSLSLVDEGWRLVVGTWLEPALRLGVWHETPFTGLRHVLDGLTDDEHRLEGPDLLTLFPGLATYEPLLAERLVRGAPHDDLPTPWATHPLAVTDRGRRASLAGVAAAAARATGAPESASVRSLHRLFSEGWGPALAATLGLPEDEPAVEQLARQVLTDAVTTLLVDTGVAVLSWEWPVGTVLRDTDGARLFPADLVASGTPLHRYLGLLGVDPEHPLSLSEDVAAAPERALLALSGSAGLASRRLILSDRALWVFPHGQTRETAQRVRFADLLEEATGDPCIMAVDSGDTAAALTRVAHREVERATLSPLLGGHWWRLRLRLSDGGTLAFHGDGGGRELERLLQGTLSDRLRVSWSHERPLRRRARNVFGYSCLALGGLSLVVSLVWLVRPDAGTTVTDALALGALGLATGLLGLVPDVVERARGHRRGVARPAPRGVYDLA